MDDPSESSEADEGTKPERRRRSMRTVGLVKSEREMSAVAGHGAGRCDAAFESLSRSLQFLHLSRSLFYYTFHFIHTLELIGVI